MLWDKPFLYILNNIFSVCTATNLKFQLKSLTCRPNQECCSQINFGNKEQMSKFLTTDFQNLLTRKINKYRSIPYTADYHPFPYCSIHFYMAHNAFYKTQPCIEIFINPCNVIQWVHSSGLNKCKVFGS